MGGCWTNFFCFPYFSFSLVTVGACKFLYSVILSLRCPSHAALRGEWSALVGNTWNIAFGIWFIIIENIFVGCTTISSTGGRSTHRSSINHALQANGELMRIGLPARGWRHTRTTASTEHLDRLHQGSMRAWEMSNNGGKRKVATTLPPNMTPPKFFNKSPREALRRVTSLLINRKGISLF